MFSKTNLISTVVGAVWAYFGGWLLWGLLGGSIFQVVSESAGDQPHVIIASLISAFAFSTIYSKLSVTEHSLSHGATYGLWVGIFVGFGDRWYDFAFRDGVVPERVLSDAITSGVLNIVFFVILGVLVSLVYDKLK
jgi:hypothetical protein